MRLAISNITAAVNGTKANVSFVPGTEVDLDQLVAEGVTLEQALGKARVAGFELVKPMKAAGGPKDRGTHAAKE